MYLLGNIVVAEWVGNAATTQESLKWGTLQEVEAAAGRAKRDAAAAARQKKRGPLLPQPSDRPEKAAAAAKAKAEAEAAAKAAAAEAAKGQPWPPSVGDTVVVNKLGTKSRHLLRPSSNMEPTYPALFAST